MAEKMRYENEIENAKVDDEFNNSEEDLSAEDIYRVYMEEIAAIPPCSEAENAKLLGEIRNGNKAARERLIEGNLKNALFFVQDYINKGVPMADLIQEASLELMMLADEGFEGSFEKLLESRIRVRMEEIINDPEKGGGYRGGDVSPRQCASGGIEIHGGGAWTRGKAFRACGAHEDDRGRGPGDHEGDHGRAEHEQDQPELTELKSTYKYK